MFPTAGGANSPPGPLFAGKYRIESQLPWGGVASYYRAVLGEKPVVLALLPLNLDSQPNLRPAFTRVARARALLRHRTVPRLIHASVAEGVPYFVLQDTRGALLEDLLDDRPLRSRSVLCVASDVLDALEAARAQDLVHADVTPRNILIVRESDQRIGARLLGLGIAPLIRGTEAAEECGMAKGSGQHSVRYMAPEMFGGRQFEHPADIYSVGALLQHMAQGSAPVRPEGGDAFHDTPGLREIVERATAKAPRDRYPNAKAMLTALEWVEIESAKRNPQTQDIAPWMEHSKIGSIPVAAVASSLPPPVDYATHPPGTVLASNSGAHVRPEPPMLQDSHEHHDAGRWWQIAILLLCLLALVLVSLWLD